MDNVITSCPLVSRVFDVLSFCCAIFIMAERKSDRSISPVVYICDKDGHYRCPFISLSDGQCSSYTTRLDNLAKHMFLRHLVKMDQSSKGHQPCDLDDPDVERQW